MLEDLWALLLNSLEFWLEGYLSLASGVWKFASGVWKFKWEAPSGVSDFGASTQTRLLAESKESLLQTVSPNVVKRKVKNQSLN